MAEKTRFPCPALQRKRKMRVGVFLPILLVAGLLRAEPVLDRFAEVDAAPVKTWVYVGSVTLAAAPFRHVGHGFEATYTAKVFPYFFYSEAGRMTIDVSDEALRQIAAGRAIAFVGRAVRSDGTVRRVEGRAVPTGVAAGRLTVKIRVSRRINLAFETTYGLPKVKASGAR